MRKLARSALLTAAGVALTICLAAASSAATAGATWTITPGGKITGNGTAMLGDPGAGANITCASHLRGSFKPGGGQANPIGKLTSVTFSSCIGPTGMTFTVTASASAPNPWPIDGTSYGAGVTHGKIANIKIGIMGAGCSARMAGTSATSPGTVNFTYTNGTHILKTSGGNLHIWNLSGCLGIFNIGDNASYDGSYTITPKQAITSP
jgi:hypothetical protein